MFKYFSSLNGPPGPKKALSRTWAVEAVVGVGRATASVCTGPRTDHLWGKGGAGIHWCSHIQSSILRMTSSSVGKST